jgi:hypothetical protein
VCAVSEVLCSVSGKHYTESGNSSISDEEKGRRVHAMRVLYMRKGRHTHGTRVSLLHDMHKKERLQNMLQGMLLAPTHNMPVGTHT